MACPTMQNQLRTFISIILKAITHVYIKCVNLMSTDMWLKFDQEMIIDTVVQYVK